MQQLDRDRLKYPQQKEVFATAHKNLKEWDNGKDDCY